MDKKTYRFYGCGEENSEIEQAGKEGLLTEAREEDIIGTLSGIKGVHFLERSSSIKDFVKINPTVRILVCYQKKAVKQQFVCPM